MKQKLVILSVIVALVALPLLVACAAPAPTPSPSPAPPEDVKTVKVGFLVPLSGEVAAWGLPGLYGVQMWEEDVNAAGGIQVGSEKYKVEIIPYDNEYVASKALLGAKKLVLEDGVSVVYMMGGTDVLATQSFLTENEMLSLTLATIDLSPDSPYLLALSEGWPMYMPGGMDYLLETHPEIKTVALVSQDDPLGLMGLAWAEAIYEAAGIEVVYEKIFGVETTDFAPIVTAMLASGADLMDFCESYPVYSTLLTEQAYLQGWEGPLICMEFLISPVLAKVPADWLEGAVSYQADWDDPMLSEESNEFYAEYVSRWPESWGGVSWMYRAGLQVWQAGVEKAGSIEPMAVLEALKAAKELPHPYGTGALTGKELFGIDNWLASPWPVTEVRNGKHTIVDIRSFSDWFAKKNNKDILMRVLEEHGL